MKPLTREHVREKGLCLDDGLCTMCGLCVAICPTKNIDVVYPANEPELSWGDRCNDCGLCYQVCPGKDIPLRELDRLVFGRERDAQRDILGMFRTCYQSHALDGEVRAMAASGGSVSALLAYALDSGRIDAAPMAAADGAIPWRLNPRLARTRSEVLGGCGTKSVVVPVNAALREVERGESVGCVGLACHVHGLRKLQHRFPEHRLAKKLAFVIGIFCGLNGPYRRIEYYLREKYDIGLDDIQSLKYRAGRDPFATVVSTKSGETLNLQWYAADMRLLVRERCALCLDWAADIADVSLGDFWGLSASGSEPERGTNTMLVRTGVGEELVNGAVESGYLKLYPTQPGPLALTTGFRQKMQINRQRFLMSRRYGWAVPDYQYEFEVVGPVDRRGVPYNFSGLPSKDRERILRERGTATLWLT
ncbi:MAG: Coenzyme F420 hydrogenase/dehydrogenase, beta subunit C-terminal domain [Chloroflexota bacterium]